LSDKILLVVNRELKKGKTPAQASAIAIRVTGAKGEIKEGILSAMVRAATIGAVGVSIPDELALRKWFLNKHFDGVKLSESIAAMNLQGVIANEIRTGLRLAKSWQSAARRLTKKNLIAGNVPGYMDDVIVAARRSFAHAGDAKAFSAYRVTVNKAKRSIGRLKGGRLAAAYENVVKQAEKGASAAMAKGVDRAVRAAYNAERIARTEIARAYGKGSFARINDDPDIEAMRWELSSAHSITDICDFHAGLDGYGMGPGVYPKNNYPAYPAHPHCTCLVLPVWVAPPATPFNTDAPKELIDKKSKRDQRALLGVKGSESYARNPRGWRKDLKSWNGHHDTAQGGIPGRLKGGG
jgi:hypothetical protein